MIAIPAILPREDALSWIRRAQPVLAGLAQQSGSGGVQVTGGRVYVGAGAGTSTGLLDIGILASGTIVQVDTSNIEDAAVATAKLADNGITTAKIASGAVTETELGALSVTNAKLAALAVDAAKLANSAVTSTKIANAAVGTAAIANAAITTALIADANVTTAKITDLAVSSAKVADAAIVTAKIGSLAVTSAKINDMAANKITAGTIGVNQVYLGGTEFELQGLNKLIVIKDGQGTPETRVKIGKMSGTTTDYGLKLYDSGGNLFLDAATDSRIYGQHVTVDALVCRDDGAGNSAIKMNGNGMDSRIEFQQGQYINGGTDGSIGITAQSGGSNHVIVSGSGTLDVDMSTNIELTAGATISLVGTTEQKLTSASGTVFVARADNSSWNSANVITAATDRAAATSFNLIAATTSYDGSADVEFLVRGDGVVASDGGTAMSTPADYAEFFETKDGKAIPFGVSVVLDGGKVRPARKNEDPIGVVRPNDVSCIIGNAAWNKWSKKYLTDDFDAPITEPFQVYEWVERKRGKFDDKAGRYRMKDVVKSVEADRAGIVIPKKAVLKSVGDDGKPLTRRKMNPDFDPSQTYTPRAERDNWVVVGLLGQVPVLKGQPAGSRWVKMGDRSADVELWFIR